MGRMVCAALFACGWLALTGLLPGAEPRPAAVERPAPAEPDDAQDLLFLGHERPVFVRLRLKVDGRSFRAAWQEFAERLFGELDHNADGLLTDAEWDRIPTADLLVEGNVRGSPQGAAAVSSGIDLSPADGLVTPDEFAAYLLLRGARPLALQSDSARERMAGGVPGGANVDAGLPLYARLDADGDGLLSHDELSVAPEALARLDFDDDGTISRAELLFGRPANAYFVPSGQSRSVAPAQFLELSADGPGERTARRLLDRYDRPSPVAGAASLASANDRLSPSELPFPAELFARLDGNADGELDFDELIRLVSAAQSELELIVRIGRRDSGQPAVEVRPLAAGLKVEVLSQGDGPLTIMLAGTLLEFFGESGGVLQARQLFQQQFQGADADNNKYLERKEVQRTFFNQVFDALDEDGDGKLFEREMLAYLARREAVAQSRCVLAVVDDGPNLFEILDGNRDGRLGRQELAAAAARLEGWDADGNGRLAEAEIPPFHRVSFGPARPNIPGLPFAFNAGPAPAGPRTSAAGPAWFQRMDRNRDGTVSRREFLGGRGAFDRLDANRDGELDPSEVR